MKSYNKALEHLEHATQRSFEANLAANDRDRCWRCLGKAGSGPSGVCDRCREVLLADLPPSEPEIPAETADFDLDAARWAISAVGGAIQAAGGRFFDDFAAGCARIGEILRQRPENGPDPDLGVVRAPGPPQIASIGTRWAETDLYAAILAGGADIHCPRGPITFPPPPEEPS